MIGSGNVLRIWLSYINPLWMNSAFQLKLSFFSLGCNQGVTSVFTFVWTGENLTRFNFVLSTFNLLDMWYSLAYSKLVTQKNYKRFIDVIVTFCVYTWNLM